MKNLEKGKDRVQQICDVIRRETLEPAEREAHRIINEGERAKLELIAEGKAEKERLIAEARAQIDQERNVFQSSIEQAMRQSLESLKQQIEKIFTQDLHHLLSDVMNEPSLLVRIVEVLIDAIDKEGLKADLSVHIARSVDAKEVSKLLSKRILERFSSNPLILNDLMGVGVQIDVKDRSMAVAITAEDVKKLLAAHLRKDFRELIFAVK